MTTVYSRKPATKFKFHVSTHSNTFAQNLSFSLGLVVCCKVEVALKFTYNL